MMDRKFTIVDVETTGGSPFFNRVIEVGAIRVVNGEVVDRFNSLINPGVEVPEFITELTGIKNSDVENAPAFVDVREELLEFFRGSTFVAHNVGFDYSFLRREFERSGFVFVVDQMCTVRLSRALYPQEKRHNLTSLIERFSFECENRHRAMDDALVLWEFIKLIQNNFSKEELNDAFLKAFKSGGKTLEEEQELRYVPVV